jgi:hypothetical protein
MIKEKQLSKRQLAVIEDMFTGELDEQGVLDKYNVSRSLYGRWLADETFAEQYEKRIDWAYRHSTALIARYAPLAAAKLVALTDSEKEEVARKACIDIISMGSSGDKNPSMNRGAKDSENSPLTNDQSLPISPQTAGKLLAVLAEEKQKDL